MFKQVIVCAALYVSISLSVSAQVVFHKQQSGAVGSPPVMADLNLGSTVDQVNYQTGTVNINIPIYEIKTRGLSIPISISYQCQSFRVGEENGMLGLGWSLNTGGGITRQVNGLPDESITGIAKNPFPNSTFSFSNLAWLSYLYKVLNAETDGSWDIFNYNLPSGNGQFVYGGMTFPYDPATKIFADIQGSSYQLYVYGKDGYEYSFKEGVRKNMRKRKWYNENSSGAPDWNISTDPYEAGIVHTTDWVINGIKSRKFPNDDITYNYYTVTDNTTRYYTSETLPYSHKVQVDPSGNIIYDNGYQVDQPILSKTKTIQVSHEQLSTINFPEGRLYFVYDGALLREIQIQKKLFTITGSPFYETVKKYVFELTKPSGSAYYQLSAVKVLGGDGKDLYSWLFNYNENHFLPDPQSDSKAQDWWGYYNGAIGNRTLLSSIFNPFLLANSNSLPSSDIPILRREAYEVYGETWIQAGYNGIPKYIPMANRDYNFDYATSQLLNKVTLPTGALVLYDYEPNQYSQIRQGSSSSKVNGAGIRIKSVKTYGSNGNFISRKDYRYGYGDPEGALYQYVESGVGFITVPGNIMGVDRNYIGVGGQIQYTIQDINLLSHPVNNIVRYNGSCVTYQAVTELTRGSNDEYGGKNVYCFFPATSTLEWNVTSNNPNGRLLVPSFYINSGIKDNLLLSTPKTIYTYTSNLLNAEAYSIIKKVENHFITFDNPKTDKGPVSFFVAIQAMLAGMENIVSQYCYFPPGANTDLVCHNYYFMPNMDDNGVSRYLAEKDANNPMNKYFTGKYGVSITGSNELGLGSYCKLLDTTTVTEYDRYRTDGPVIKNIMKYENKSHLLPTWIGTINSNKDTLIQHLRYPYDYPLVGGRIIGNGVKTDPIEKIQTIHRPGYDEQLLGGELRTYKLHAGTGIWNIDKIFTLNLQETSPLLSGYLYYNGDTTKDSRYEMRQYNEVFDDYGNLTQFIVDGKRTAMLWGYNDQQVIASVSNAYSSEIAYTDFETSSRVDEGSWVRSMTSGTTGTVPGGKIVTLSSLANGIQKGNINSYKEYIVSYYSTSTTPYKIAGTFNVDKTPTGGGWTYYRHMIRGVNSINIQSPTGDTNSQIGELRLYPAGSLMITASYLPLFGIRSTGDATGRIKHYEFDSGGRLEKERDEYTNILNFYQYMFRVTP
ncbi:hypothetical protein DVR12_17130 [Chitinophaga silvatica]|uniref:YD repeat-containing protein n=2 Tax=Chitinophaga silvatica TaxID=2282649 RepID=A0A3E1Y7R4_9BACT|nr:hypothetical protein DVR12_17130 [Chitinophaga silvatica]